MCTYCLVSSKLPTNHIAKRAALLDFPNQFCFIFIYFLSSLIDCLALAGQETTKKNTNLPLTITMYIIHCWREWRNKRTGAIMSSCIQHSFIPRCQIFSIVLGIRLLLLLVLIGGHYLMDISLASDSRMFSRWSFPPFCRINGIYEVLKQISTVMKTEKANVPSKRVEEIKPGRSHYFPF